MKKSLNFSDRVCEALNQIEASKTLLENYAAYNNVKLTVTGWDIHKSIKSHLRELPKKSDTLVLSVSSHNSNKKIATSLFSLKPEGESYIQKETVGRKTKVFEDNFIRAFYRKFENLVYDLNK